MKSEESRFADSTVFEGMTSIRAVIKAMTEGISDRRIVEILYDRDRAASKSKEISYLSAVSEKLSFKVRETDGGTISKMTVGASHGGIIAVCSERTIPSLSPGLIKPSGFYVMIEGIEDPYNFGYAIRSIYAAGADGIVLSPRNWMSAAGVVCRSSAGASEMIDLYQADAASAVESFRQNDYKIVSAGIRNSVSAYDADLTFPVFLIVGGEKRGISSSVLGMCDMIVRLDYGREFKGSLSAASASSILAYEILRQNRKKI